MTNERTLLLAADLGGTKALIGLFEPDPARPAPGPLVFECRLACADYDGFEPMLVAALQQARGQGVRGRIARGCIAMAGPVTGRHARMTNLPWDIDADRLEACCDGAPMALANDFEAAAVGIEWLGPGAVRSLREAEPIGGLRAPRLAIGAGTGLGVALLAPAHGGWRVLPGEGGHVGFAPRSPRELALWSFLHARETRVTYERIACGPGLVALHDFVRHEAGLPPARAPGQGDAAAAIAALALTPAHPLPGGDGEAARLAAEALDLFASVLGAFAGDLALLALPRSGLYLAGGIAPKVFDDRRLARFLAAFDDKGGHSPLMRSIPLRLVTEPRLGLLGAAALAARAQREAAPGGSS